MCLLSRRSIYCILPPYVLDSIAQNGTAQQRAIALRTKAADATIRALRLASRAARFAPGRAAPPTPGVIPTKVRTVHTANNGQALPGTVVRAEGQGATGDAAVDEAYEGLGATFDYFDKAHGRNSIDDEGMPLIATVHFGDRYNNAFWNSEQMVFGDGDGMLFNRFTRALDVIGHELAHGVVEDESQLRYFLQSGALNESLADVFGSLVKQSYLKQKADQADWLIGAGLLAPAVNGTALRSMKAPGTAFDDPVLGKDPQPGHMSKYVNTFEDNGGVHINSGIPNHAFYRVATQLGGYAWEKAGRIWYDALLSPQVRPNTGFKRFARITAESASRLYGPGSAEHNAVRGGWEAVGIQV